MRCTMRENNNGISRPPDCVSEIRMGNTILVVSGYFKSDATHTADDKMLKVLRAEHDQNDQNDAA